MVMSEQPAGFNEYWDKLEDELARYPARPELEIIPMRSTHFCTVYWAKITSIGPYRIGGYLSIPHGDAPFPAIMQTPKYGSVNHVPDYNDRKRYVMFTLMHRGQRLTDEPWASAYPGLLTEGVTSQDSYIYRSVVADCLRGAEFLLSRPEVDSNRAAIVGDDLALITASRRPGFTHAHGSGLLFYRLMENAVNNSAYPVEEINDYLRTNPDQKDNVANTLSHFDPIHHAAGMRANTLMSVGDEGAVGGPEWLEPLINKIGGTVEEYRVTHRGGTDNDAIDAWLANKLGTTAMSKFRRTTP
jgi:cephalosporin-C deacetylase